MTPDQRDIAVTTITIAGAFLIAILAVCWAVASIAIGLADWMTTR